MNSFGDEIEDTLTGLMISSDAAANKVRQFTHVLRNSALELTGASGTAISDMAAARDELNESNQVLSKSSDQAGQLLSLATEIMFGQEKELKSASDRAREQLDMIGDLYKIRSMELDELTGHSETRLNQAGRRLIATA